MRSLLLPHSFSPELPLKMTGDTFHYLSRVLRLSRGDTLAGTDREGRRYLLVITEMDHESLVVEVREKRENGNTETAICLFQALLKGKKMDTVVRQAAEAGVKRIVPVKSEYTVARYDAGEGKKKRQRWEAIAREAVQQSGSTVITEIEEPVDIDELPRIRNDGDPALFFHHEPLEQTSLHRYLSHYPNTVALGVGPEGGFSPREVELLRGGGFLPVHLQTNVLRAETAALYAIAAVQTLLAERVSWNPQE
jgi:16S rRNA (uracil1498-N3)-methyltransferase